MNQLYIVVQQDDSLIIVKANHRPTSYKAVYFVPEGVERAEDAKIVEVTDESGTRNEAQLDQDAKDSRLAAEATQTAADQATKDANQYKIDRKNAYPSIGDQLDALYKKLHLDDSTEYDALAAVIAQVKTDNPKPE